VEISVHVRIGESAHILLAGFLLICQLLVAGILLEKALFGERLLHFTLNVAESFKTGLSALFLFFVV
jgi:hypothetical protein